MAQPADDKPAQPTLEVYGFAMLDVGFDAGDIGDPLWQDTLRPTKLPSFEDEFGKAGRWFAGVRQSRFGVKANLPTDYGELKTTFEFEMFGVGPDEGQTTMRLRHAVADWNQLRAGQTWSPFMDIDVFPNSVEYWGPNGMAFYRNVQVAWMPIQGDSRVTVALERPGGSPDTGIYTGRIELEDVAARFPLPDLSAEGRFGGPWGHVELAGIVRYIRWDDLGTTPPVIEDEVWGWGLNLSSNLKLGPHVIRASAVYGEAIQNYMNDAGADVGPEDGDGVALPCLGLVGFVDLNWNEQFTSTAGYSMVWIDNSDEQTPDAFHIGHYALANVLVHPVPELFFGPELQWGRRENNSDGWEVDDFRVQVSVKGTFSRLFEGM